jgi:hypothetical protein
MLSFSLAMTASLLYDSLYAIVMAFFQQQEDAVLMKDRARVIHVFRDVTHQAAHQLSAIFGQQRVGASDALTVVMVLAPLLDDIPVTEFQFVFDHYHFASGKNPNPQ